MAHSLTEVDEFVGPITVPDDTDDATAASVERPLQALTNRTKNLNRRLGDAEAAIDVSETNIAGLEGRVTTAEADIDSLEGRVTAAEARTLQGVFDVSLEMVGDTPTATIDVPFDAKFVVAGEGSRELRSGRTGFAALDLTPFAEDGVALDIKDRGYVQFQGDAGSFRVAADAAVATHGMQTPSAPNATTKAALVRAPGTGTQPTEWMPMDWGDTDGGGSGWAMNLTGIGIPSGSTPTGQGRWQRVGDVVSFSATGDMRVDPATTALFVDLPVPSNLTNVRNLAAACNIVSYSDTPGSEKPLPNVISAWCEGEMGTPDKMRVRMSYLDTGTLDCRWHISGHYRVK